MPIDDENEDSRYGDEGLTLEEQDRAAEGGDSRPRDPEEPSVPSSIKAQDELIDQASDDSFPASDPPAYWQRPATHHSGAKERSDLANDGKPDSVA
jgi:hypothetical protein